MWLCDWWPFEWQGGVTRNLVAYSRERRIGDMVTKMSHGVPPRSDKGVSQPTVPRGVMSKIGTWWPGVPDVRLWCPWRLVTGWRRPLDIWWLVASPTVPAADVRPAPDKAGAGGEASMNNISRTFALPPLHNFPALSERNLRCTFGPDGGGDGCSDTQIRDCQCPTHPNPSQILKPADAVLPNHYENPQTVFTSVLRTTQCPSFTLLSFFLSIFYSWT